MTVLPISPERQNGNYLCWQAVTNIFSIFYKQKLYFYPSHNEQDVCGDVETGISLATGRNVLDIIPNDFDGMVNTIENKNHLIYACLEYYTLNSNLQKTNISYHATVIHGVNPETQEFLLYDTQDGTETWYTYTGRNDTYTDSQFLNFCIYKLAALK